MMGGRMRGQPVVALLAVLCGWAGGRLSAWDAEPSIAAPAANAAISGAGGQGGYRADPAMGPQSLGGQALGSPTLADGYGTEPPPIYGLIPGYEGRQYWQRGAMMPRGAVLRQVRVAGYPGGVAYVLVPGPAGRGRGWPVAERDPALFAQGDVGGEPVPNWTAGDTGRDFPQTPTGAVTARRLPAGLPSFALLSTPLPIDAPAGAGQIAPPEAQDGAARPAFALKRWSVDSWALLRGNGAGPLANGALPATYGASQTGAIVRYRLARQSPYRPEVYLRTTTTLGQTQHEIATAIGLAARPVPAFPVVAALEARLTQQAGQHWVQPVGMAITALPPFELPHRLRGETYAQAGYVGGKFATPFAEGQLRVDHGLFTLARAETRLGGGLWGGVQKGAGRLDAGPSATLALPLAKNVFGRLAVDWRFRVAGDAKPDSGPAVTLSAGF